MELGLRKCAMDGGIKMKSGKVMCELEEGEVHR